MASWRNSSQRRCVLLSTSSDQFVQYMFNLSSLSNSGIGVKGRRTKNFGTFFI